MPLSIIWLMAALVAGIGIITQPPELAVVVISIALLLLTAAMTPLAAVAALLILAPLRTLVITESPLALPLDIGQLAFLAFIYSWFVYRVRHKNRMQWINGTALYVPLLLLIVYTGFTGFTSFALSGWLNEWLKWIQIAILIVFVVDMAASAGWQWLIFGLAAAGMANAIIGIYEFFGGSGADHLLINDRFFRAFGTFGQPNPFAGFMGLLAPLIISAALAWAVRCWRDTKNLLWPGFYGLVTLLMITGILMSWSRGAWLGFAGSIAVMVFAFPRRVRYGLLLFLLLTLIGGFLWSSSLLPESITARIRSSTEEFFAFQDVRGVDITPENYAVVERLSHWQAALNMAREHPWFGVGPGNYELVYNNFRLINWDEPLGHAHNYYLNTLAEMGIMGVIIYLFFWGCVTVQTWKLRDHPDPFTRTIGIGLLGSWTYLLIHSFFDNLFVNNMFLHIGLMLGLLAVLHAQFTRFDRVAAWR